MAEDIDVMMDLETLGRRAGCVVLSIGCVVMSAKHGVHDGLEGRPDQKFYCALPIDPQKDVGLHVDPETEAWWRKQSSAARDVFKECDAAGSLVYELGKFEAWMKSLGGKPSIHVWGNGSDFDNAIMTALYAALDDRPLPWQYWNSSCYRTLKNRQSIKQRWPAPERSGTFHNALDDAVTQAHHAVAILNGLKMW